MQQSTVGTATGTTGPYQRCQPQVHADNNTALQVLFVTGRTEHSCGRHPGFVLSSESCPEHMSYTPQQVLGHPRAVSQLVAPASRLSSTTTTFLPPASTLAAPTENACIHVLINALPRGCQQPASPHSQRKSNTGHVTPCPNHLCTPRPTVRYQHLLGATVRTTSPMVRGLVQADVFSLQHTAHDVAHLTPSHVPDTYGVCNATCMKGT
jgi:hypothetical protein